jgi:hypothetical protein
MVEAMPRWIPPDPETESALNIGFEIQMLGELPRWVMRFDDDKVQIPMVACQEATLLHARALIEFLFGRPRSNGSRYRKPSDESPARFGTTWVSSDPTAFDDWLDLIDKHLVHLSTNRVGANGSVPEYYLTDIVDGLLAALEDFVKGLESDGSAQQMQFRAALQQAKVQRMKDTRRWPSPQAD